MEWNLELVLAENWVHSANQIESSWQGFKFGEGGIDYGV